MDAIKVTINEEAPVVAGIAGHGVVHAIVTWLSRSDATDPTHETPEFDISISGLEPGVANVTWLDRTLAVGDRLLVEIVEVPTADKPITRKKIDVAKDERREREYYECLKRKYG